MSTEEQKDIMEALKKRILDLNPEFEFYDEDCGYPDKCDECRKSTPNCGNPVLFAAQEHTGRKKTDEELLKLAEDWIAGQVFTSLDVVERNEMNCMAMVFAPLAFMGQDEIMGYRVANVGFLYEYLSRAGPRSINGMPIFMSFGILTEADTIRLMFYVEKLCKKQEEARKELLNEK